MDLLLSLIDALDKLMVYAVRGSVHNFAEISQVIYLLIIFIEYVDRLYSHLVIQFL